MSHFVVMVIGRDYEKALAPYQEKDGDNVPKEYLEFYDKEEEYKEKYETETTTKVVMPDGRLLNTWDEEFRIKGQIGTGTDTYKVPEGLERKEIPVKELYKTFEEYMSDYCGYEEKDPEKGRYGYWQNPNRKWDWYSVGGRWSGYFKLKDKATGIKGNKGLMGSCKNDDENHADLLQKKDIDVDGMRYEAEVEARKEYENVLSLFNNEIPKIKIWKEFLEEVEKKIITIDEARTQYHDQEAVKIFNKTKQDPFLDLDTFQISKEEYIQKARNKAITTFAVIKDGKWYERGEMGWWGCVSNEKDQKDWDKEFSDLFDSIPDDEYITIVDCHI